MSEIEITDRQLADLQDWAAHAGRHELVADCELALQAGEGMGASDREAREARSRCADAMAGIARDPDGPAPGEIVAAIDAAVAARVRRMARDGATLSDIIAYVRAWSRRVDAAGADVDALAAELAEVRDET